MNPFAPQITPEQAAELSESISRIHAAFVEAGEMFRRGAGFDDPNDDIPDEPPAPADLPFPDLCRHAARQAAFATGQLLQADEPGDLRTDETPLILADALRSTMQAVSAGKALDDADAQLLGALERYLDGWAG